jgi:hypothetical protein
LLRASISLAIWLAYGTLSFWAGTLAFDWHTTHSRALLRANLAACNYTPHPIADVTWELVRTGKIPVGTAAFWSATVTSKNLPAAALKACMAKHYGG